MTASLYQQAAELSRIVDSYDINCKYKINLLARLLQGIFTKDQQVLPEVAFVVPKMHLQSHNEICQDNHSLNFILNCARAYGEGIEANWYIMNALQYQAREMTPGHRKETITYHCQEMNWRKLIEECLLTCSLSYFSYGVLNNLHDVGFRVLDSWVETRRNLIKNRDTLMEIESTMTPDILQEFHAFNKITKGEKYRLSTYVNRTSFTHITKFSLSKLETILMLVPTKACVLQELRHQEAIDARVASGASITENWEPPPVRNSLPALWSSALDLERDLCVTSVFSYEIKF